MAETFRVYIDEAGDEGFRFGEGSSKWFVLSAVILPAATELKEVKLVDEVKQRLRREPVKKPLHFIKLKHDASVLFLDHISRCNITAVNLLVHKPSLASVAA